MATMQMGVENTNHQPFHTHFHGLTYPILQKWESWALGVGTPLQLGFRM